jgi:hypothetical protein
MPIGALPVDSDTPNVSSILQPLKESLDWIGALSQWMVKYGITPWSASASYAAGTIVQSPSTPYSTFRVKYGHSASVGLDPAGDPTNWEPWGHTDTEIANLLPVVETDTSNTGIAVVVIGTFGTISDVCWSAVGFSTVIKRCSFRLGTGSGGVTATITFSGAKAFGSGIKNVQVTGVHVGSSITNADAFITSANVIVVSGDLGGDDYFVTVEGY